MKTITVNLYSLEELSPEAQQTAHDEWIQGNYDGGYAWEHENIQTLEEFIKIFPVELNRRGDGFVITNTNNAIEHDLSGVRLATYIWNNYRTDLFRGKYYGSFVRGSLLDSAPKHYRIKTEVLTSGDNKGKFWCAYHSAILLDNSCVLTGYAMDDAILQPIYEFLKKPDARTFADLLHDCFHEWEKAVNADRKYQDSFEYFHEACEANDYTFTESGKMKNA